jgi:predicted MFS family arabinose efflux permease
VSGPTIALVCLSLLALAAFVGTESRRPDPLVDLALIRTRPFCAADLCAFGYGVAFFAGAVAVPVIAGEAETTGYGLGLSVTEIGLLLLPTSLAGLLGGWWGGRAFDRIGARAQVTLGALLAAVGYVSLAANHDTVLSLAAGSALIGFSWGLVPSALYPVVLRAAGVDKTGIAASVVLVARNIGVSVGITTALALLASAEQIGGAPSEAAITRALVFGAVATAAFALLAAWLPGRMAND